MSTSPPGADALWEYVVALYAVAPVRDALLRLQDEHGGDVDIVLYACWHGASGRGSLAHDELGTLEAAIAGWREAVTRELRALRRRIDTEPALAAAPRARAVRAQILGAEVASERTALELMAATARRARPVPAGTRRAHCQASLEAYLSRLPGGSDRHASLIEIVVGHAVTDR